MDHVIPYYVSQRCRVLRLTPSLTLYSGLSFTVHKQLIDESLEQWFSQWLGEDIRKVCLCSDLNYVQFSADYLFSHEVIFDGDMLDSAVEFWISRQLVGSDIVNMELDWFVRSVNLGDKIL